MELPWRNKERSEIKKYIIPVLGTLAAGYAVRHRGEVTAYVQKYRDGSFMAGLAKGQKVVIKEVGASSRRFHRLRLDSNNMDTADLELFGEIMSEEQE